MPARSSSGEAIADNLALANVGEARSSAESCGRSSSVSSPAATRFTGEQRSRLNARPGRPRPGVIRHYGRRTPSRIRQLGRSVVAMRLAATSRPETTLGRSTDIERPISAGGAPGRGARQAARRRGRRRCCHRTCAAGSRWTAPERVGLAIGRRTARRGAAARRVLSLVAELPSRTVRHGDIIPADRRFGAPAWS